MLLQLLEANLYTPKEEEDLIFLKIELDKYREKFFPDSDYKKLLQEEKDLILKKRLKLQAAQKQNQDQPNQNNNEHSERQNQIHNIDQTQRMILSQTQNIQINRDNFATTSKFDNENGPQPQNTQKEQNITINPTPQSPEASKTFDPVKFEQELEAEAVSSLNKTVFNFVNKKDRFILIAKILTGISFFIISIQNENKEVDLNTQNSKLNDYLLCISAFMIIEAYKDLAEEMIEKEVEKKIFSWIALKKARIYQTISAILLIAFVIYGYIKIIQFRDVDQTIQNRFVQEEQTKYDYLVSVQYYWHVLVSYIVRSQKSRKKKNVTSL
eukprot:403355978